MDDIVYATAMCFARNRFEQLAESLRAALKGIPPSGNHEGTVNLYQDYWRDTENGCSEWAWSAWRETLFDLLHPVLASMSLAEKRLLYLATDNGGMAAEEVDEIFCTGPWIEEEIINRASQRSGSASGC